MIPVRITNEEMKELFPLTYNAYLQDLRNSCSKSANKAEEKIEWMIAWGIFGPKTKNESHAIQKQIDYDNKLKLTYDERCAVDLQKLRVSVSMKAGYYIRTDRAIDTEIPQMVIDMFYQVTKITMLQEQLILKDPVVMQSLEEFKPLLDDLLEGLKNIGLEFEGVENIVETKKEEPLDMDEILDKISASGIESLNARELKYLEKMSKS